MNIPLEPVPEMSVLVWVFLLFNDRMMKVMFVMVGK